MNPCQESASFGIVRRMSERRTTGRGLGAPHPVGADLAVLWHKTRRIEDPALKVDVEVEVGVEGARLVISKLTLHQRPGGPPVTIDILKSLPVARLAAEAAAGGPLSGLHRRKGNGWAPARAEDLAELSEAEQAAVIYRAAYFAGLPPTAAVAEALGITNDMAAKRVQAARLAGLLEPTTKGRKGT